MVHFKMFWHANVHQLTSSSCILRASAPNCVLVNTISSPLWNLAPLNRASNSSRDSRSPACRQVKQPFALNGSLPYIPYRST